MSNQAHQSKFQIVLLRHGESVGNANGYHQGQAEFPLTEKGRQQARALGAFWFDRDESFDAVIASPQIRAKETAQIISAALQMQIEFDPIWMERDNGVYAGLRWEEAQERYPSPDFQPIYERIGESGESEWELYLRGGHAIQRVLYRPPGKYLVVSHGAILNMTLRAILGIAPQSNFQGARFRWRNTSFASLEYHPERHQWIVIGVNQRPHWPEEAE